ncbi:MAG: glycosyltransferase [Candidatus Binatia bacterium]|nr:glycosyltransferase [Candidatus Binatia bacterium]
MTPPTEGPQSSASPSVSERVHVDGKFFRVGDERLYVRGVTYGPFRPTDDSEPFPTRDQVARDFELIGRLGANTVRTFTPPPLWLLDQAAKSGLRVIAGIPWSQHVCFLEQGGPARDARDRVARVAAVQGRHPAVLALLLGNETPADIVRWEGPARVERFLRELAEAARERAPETLLSYANFPPTEYLDLGFFDFLSFNVYLHREADLRRYLARLQNLAEERPLVLTELGRDSLRDGEVVQAETLSWQLDAVFDGGAAGAVVFSFTDDWFAIDRDDPNGGVSVDDWAFGVVDSQRTPKPAFEAVRGRFEAPLPTIAADAPLVSVVVCAYDEERTLGACLAALEKLDYPRFEVVVVDDGSTDRTAQIADSHAGSTIRVVHQENRGLGAARNRGIAEARGEVIAFTDADCVVDAAWLGYLVGKLRDGFVAVGGPNLSPPETALVPSVVAVAPGGPTHVLLDDDVAEHVPGCNMAFEKTALERIGGFREAYRVAGDDVDVCWRLQDAGERIGFSPAAVVWHFRRHTARAYLRQQMGYGRAEARLYFDHPLRFNALGQSRWLGRIYGGLFASLFSNAPRIYHGVFGEGLFQTLYEQPGSAARQLPLTLEWNVVAILILITGALSGDFLLLSALPLCVSVGSAIAAAARAPLAPPFCGGRGRAVLAALVYLGPLVRSFERTRARVRGTATGPRAPWPRVAPVRASVSLPRAEVRLAYWSTSGTSKDSFLGALMGFLERRQCRVTVDSGWNAWDLEISRGPWTQAQLQVAIEDHGGPRRLLRVRASLQPARIGLAAIVVCIGAAGLGAAFGVPGFTRIGAVFGVVAAVVVVVQNVKLGRVVTSVVHAVASELELSEAKP